MLHELLGLGLEVSDIDTVVARSNHATEISSQCVVFAESEVITHINNGEPVADIFAGICASMGRIVAAQARRLTDIQRFTLTGGVARFSSVVDVVSRRLGLVYEPFPYDPKLAAAIGVALLEAEVE